MSISVSTWLGGAGIALFTYLLTLVVALFVVGVIWLVYRLIHRKGKAPGPPKEERKIEEILT
jgi:flagellar biogenesis protein FliO